MATQLEQLMFNVSLLDGVSGPVRHINKTIGTLKNDVLKAFTQIGAGAAGMFGAGYALSGMIEPARDVKRSLGELASLDVDNDSLNKMLKKSLGYSVKFGENANDFIASAYDIQSSIDSLDGKQLANITNASNVLAKATKSNAATITNYMGTMYGIFKNSAKQMGVDAWADNLAGMTAQSVKMFKTTGGGMAEYFGNLGAEAQSLNISLPEQMAVGGMLQSTMSGSEAGTKYKSFLQGIGKAQKELGLKFTDDAGRMLPIVDVLSKIQDKFGSLDKIEDNDIVKKAFGTKEAVALVKLLGKDLDSLNNNIDVLGRNNGLIMATEMAKKMVDPVDRVTSGMKALRIAFGMPLSNWLDPHLHSLADGMLKVLMWADEYPHLTKAISLTGGSFIALIGVLSTLALLTGLAKLAFVGLRTAMLVFLPIVWATNLAMGVLRGLFMVGMFIRTIGVVGILSKGLATLRAVILAVNIAMWANPVGFIVGGIIALIAVVGGLIFFWDDLRVAFADNAFIMGLMDIIELLFVPFKLWGEAIDWVTGKWDGAKSGLGDSLWSQLLIAAVDLVLHPLDSLKNMFGTVQSAWVMVTDYFKSSAWATKFESIINSVKGIIDGLMAKWTAFMSKIDAVKSKISGGFDSVKETLGIKKKPLPLISGSNVINLGNSVSDAQMLKAARSPLPKSMTNNVVQFPENNIHVPKVDVPTAPVPNNVTNLHVPKQDIAPKVDIPKAPVPNNLIKLHVPKQTEKVQIESMRKPRSRLPEGGISQVINKQQQNTTNNQKNGMRVDTVNIYPKEKMDAFEFEKQLDMVNQS